MHGSPALLRRGGCGVAPRSAVPETAGSEKPLQRSTIWWRGGLPHPGVIPILWRMDDSAPPPPSRAEIDAKIAAAEARTDSKFAQLLGEIKVANSRLNHIEMDLRDIKERQRSLTITVIGTGIGAVAVIIAVMGYGATWFGLGSTIHDVAYSAATEAVEQYRRGEPTTQPPAQPPPAR